MKKLILTVLTISTFTLSNLVSAQGLIGLDYAFKDVPAINSPFYESVNYLKSKNWISGYDDGTFRPYHTINRAEFLKIVVGSLKYDLSKYNSTNLNFKDTDSNSWYALYLKAAITEQLVSGYPDGTFRPANEISFVEAAKIISKAKQLSGKSGTEWYEEYVNALADAQAIPTTINSFDKKIARGEMAQMIHRIDIKQKLPTQTFTTLKTLSEQKPVQIVFDGCGKTKTYQNSNWYNNLSQDVQLIGSYTEDYSTQKKEWAPYELDAYVTSEYVEICHSPDSQILIIGFDLNNIYKYDIKTRMFYPGKVKMPNESSGEFVEFGKRSGNIIPFTSKYGDAGCMLEHLGNYDFYNNTVTLTKDNSYCVEN